MSSLCTKRVTGAFALALLLAAPTVAQSLANALTRATTLEVVPQVQDYESVVLTIAGPDGIYLRREFSRGDAVSLDLAGELGSSLRDGAYTWEMVLVPRHLERDDAGGELSAAPAASTVESGSFTIANGVMVDASLPEARFAKDIVHADDVIVDGSLCVGFDCVNNESFGFDTIRLKENNLRIHFDDTSNSGSFPSNDWRVVINDSSNGGASYFGVEDSTAGRRPFTIEAGAPANSLYVENDGDVGIGTTNPVVNVHAVDGNTPTLRLEQNGSSGFTPQTWDVAGNEAGFFVRDVTNGSQLPFRIIPGADSSSLVITADNDVLIAGNNATSADASLHVKRSNNTAQILVEDTASTTSGAQNMLELRNAGAVQFLLNNTARVGTGAQWQFRVRSDGGFVISDVTTGGTAQAIFDDNGDLQLQGNVITTNCPSGCGPDYVFGDGYALMSLDELGTFIEQNRHLPNVPPAVEMETNGINMTQLQLRLLEKVEELTLYTLHQEKAIDALRQEKEALEARLSALEDK